jgi:hypothetical protein
MISVHHVLLTCSIFYVFQIDFVKVKCVVELQGIEHARLVNKVLEENDYDPVWDGD